MRRIPVIFLIALLLTGGGAPAWARTKKGGPSPEKRYELATAAYNELRADAERVKARKNWEAAGVAFARIYQESPRHELAPVALFNLAKIRQSMANRFGQEADRSAATAYYEEMATRFPNHPYAGDALQAEGLLYLQDGKHDEQAARVFAKLIALYPNGDQAATAAAELTALKGKASKAEVKKATAGVVKSGTTGKGKAVAELVEIRNWSTKDYTRVVIETSAPIAFKEERLPEGKEQAGRVAVVLSNCRLAGEPKKTIPVRDGLLKQVRSVQLEKDAVRVVLDTESLAEYKVFELANPARLIIDVKGKARVAPPALAKSAPASAPAPNSVAGPPPGEPSLARQLGLGVKRIIIDPGHGGKDPGAIGPDGLQEKDIVLQLALELRRKLRRQLECEVVLTREEDVFIPLEERTAIANTREGDIFVSLHVNAAPSTKARGIETYFLDLAVNKEAMRVAARENASSSRQLSELQGILKSLMQNTKINESSKLANTVQEQMVSGLNREYDQVQNLGIKKAPFIVLIGAQMPAILLEVAFLSNPQEAKRLHDEHYLNALSDQIAVGIIHYAGELSVASLRN